MTIENMTTYICQICGDAYLGEAKPKNCPFCGAHEAFIREGDVYSARRALGFLPVVKENINLSAVSKKNIEEFLSLELKAKEIYLCMAGKAKSYEIEAMFKRLSKVELEHANIACKILKIKMPDVPAEKCSDEEIENFKKTIELEARAAGFYHKFAQEASEQPIKIMFTALAQAEEDHIKLVRGYLK